MSYQRIDRISEEVRREVDAIIREELGDLLFAITNISRFLGIDPEDALNATSNKFITRFGHVESAAQAQGRRLEDMTLAEMDALWEEAKTQK